MKMLLEYFINSSKAKNNYIKLDRDIICVFSTKNEAKTQNMKQFKFLY